MTSTEESKIHEDLMFLEENYPDEYMKIQKDYMRRSSDFKRKGYMFKTICDVDEFKSIEKALLKEGFNLEFDFLPINPFDNYSKMLHHIAIFGRKPN